MQGPEVEAFERSIANYCGRKFALAVGSCTDALHFSLLDAGVNQGHEVLVPGFSFVASASAIPKVGATPVFVDINKRDYMMDLSDLEKKLTKKTKAIIGVHLFGGALDIQEVERLASSAGLELIEDAAQSIGNSFLGRNVGSMGRYSCISFDPTKLLSAQSNSGVLLTDDSDSFERIKRLRYHGKNDKTGMFEDIGYNSRISTLQAAFLAFNLTQLDGWIERNRNIARIYNQELAGVSEITAPAESGSRHTYHKFVIQVDDRNELQAFLRSRGIETGIHYKHPLSEQPLFGRTDKDLGNIQAVSGKVLSLPIHPWLTEEEVFEVIKGVKDFYARAYN
jgi:dTDP-4-amino-4,6-dideoxygalactose transaminase